MNRIVVLLLALALGACASAERARATTRILIFNIHAGKDAAGQPNLDAVAGIIHTTAADIVLLQEVDRGTRRSGGDDQIARLSTLTGYAMAFGRSLDYDGGQYGIAALSRQPVSASSTESLPIEPPQARAGGSYEPRAALLFATGSRTGPLQVVNTHLDASGDERYRLQESAHIISVVRRLAGSGVPVLAAGDFNAEPGSRTYDQLVASGMKDAWKECGAGDGFTYPADKPVKRIDYLWLPADLRCTSAEVIDSRASDHRPLLVTITR